MNDKDDKSLDRKYESLHRRPKGRKPVWIATIVILGLILLYYLAGLIFDIEPEKNNLGYIRNNCLLASESFDRIDPGRTSRGIIACN